MTRRGNARIAGISFLSYIVIGVASMFLYAQATGGENVSAKLVSVAQHPLQLRLAIVCGLLEAVCAILLGVTLYRITRDEDRDLALLAMSFRLCEGLIGALGVRSALAMLWLATATSNLIPASVNVLGAYLFQAPQDNLAAIFFALGSTLFSYLLLRGRLIPARLARLGVFASALLVVALPLQLTGLLHGAIASLVWLPMAVYEIPLGFWLIVKGVSELSVRESRV
jgi:hypothetical protein